MADDKLIFEIEAKANPQGFQQSKKEITEVGKVAEQVNKQAAASTERWYQKQVNLKQILGGLRMEFPLIARGFALLTNPIVAGGAVIAVILKKVYDGFAALREAQKAVVAVPLQQSIEAQTKALEGFKKGLDSVRESYGHLQSAVDETLARLKAEADFQQKLIDLQKEKALVLLEAEKGTLSEGEYAQKKQAITGRAAAQSQSARAEAFQKERGMVVSGLEQLGTADEASAKQLADARKSLARFQEIEQISREIAGIRRDIVEYQQKGRSIPGYMEALEGILSVKVSDMQYLRKQGAISPAQFEEQQRQSETGRADRAARRTAAERRLREMDASFGRETTLEAGRAQVETMQTATAGFSQTGPKAAALKSKIADAIGRGDADTVATLSALLSEVENLKAKQARELADLRRQMSGGRTP